MIVLDAKTYCHVIYVLLPIWKKSSTDFFCKGGDKKSDFYHFGF